MLFRNLTVFRFDPISLSVEALNEALGKYRQRAIGPLEVSVTGFVSPCESAVREVFPVDLVYSTSGLPCLVCVGTTQKILPSTVIAEHLDKKVRELAQRENRKVGAKERKRLKDEVLTDLLPRAFTKELRTLAYLDMSAGWLVVNTGSRKGAEGVVTQLREALGSFPATPLAPEESPRALLTRWISTGEVPREFALGDECELRDPAEGGGKWVGRAVDLESVEVREHLRSGMQAFRVGMTYDDRLSFALVEDLSIRKLRFLDTALDDITGESAGDIFASEYALMCLEVRKLLVALSWCLGFAQPLRRAA